MRKNKLKIRIIKRKLEKLLNSYGYVPIVIHELIDAENSYVGYVQYNPKSWSFFNVEYVTKVEDEIAIKLNIHFTIQEQSMERNEIDIIRKLNSILEFFNFNSADIVKNPYEEIYFAYVEPNPSIVDLDKFAQLISQNVGIEFKIIIS